MHFLRPLFLIFLIIIFSSTICTNTGTLQNIHVHPVSGAAGYPSFLKNSAPADSLDLPPYHQTNPSILPRAAASPQEIRRKINTYKTLSAYHRSKYKDLFKILKSTSNPPGERPSPAQLSAISETAKSTVLAAPTKNANLHDHRAGVSKTVTQLHDEERHQEAKDLTKAVKGFTRSWGRFHGLLKAVHDKNSMIRDDFHRPVRQLKIKAQTLRTMTPQQKAWVDDPDMPAAKAMVERLARNRVKGSEVYLEAERETKESLLAKMDRLRLKGEEGRAEDLRFHYRGYKKAFGSNLGFMIGVERRRKQQEQEEARTKEIGAKGKGKGKEVEKETRPEPTDWELPTAPHVRPFPRLGWAKKDGQ